MAKRFIDLNELELELKRRGVPVTFRPEQGKYQPHFLIAPGAVKFEEPTIIYDPAGFRHFDPWTQPYSTVTPSSDGRYTDYGWEGGPLLSVGGGWVPRRTVPDRLALHSTQMTSPAAVFDCIDRTETSFSSTCTTASDAADEIEALYLVAVQTIDARSEVRRRQDAEDNRAVASLFRSLFDSALS